MRRMPGLVGWGVASSAIVLALAGSALARSAETGPVLNSAVGKTNGYIAVSWTPASPISLFQDAELVISSVSGACDAFPTAQQGCDLRNPVNGNEHVDVNATTYTSRSTYKGTAWVQVCYFGTAQASAGEFCSNVISVTLPTSSSSSGGGSTGSGGGASGSGGTSTETDFTLSASQSSVSVSAGSSAQVTLSWGAIGGYVWGGVLQTVGGGPTGLPPGASASSPGGSGSAIWTIATSASTPGGSYPLVWAVTDSKKTHTVSVTLVVAGSTTAGGCLSGLGGANLFQLQVMPAAVTLSAGQRTSVKINVQCYNHFSDSVTFAFDALSKEIQGTFNPPSSPKGTSLSLLVAPTTHAGSYTIRINGASGSVSDVADLTVNVQGAATGAATASVKAISIPNVPASNGTRACDLARADLMQLNKEAAAKNTSIASKKLTQAQAAAYAKIFAEDQQTLDYAASIVASLYCASLTPTERFSYVPYPTANNGSTVCAAARATIDYYNGELRKAYGNISYTDLSDSSADVRLSQLWTRIAQLKRQAIAGAQSAFNACK